MDSTIWAALAFLVVAVTKYLTSMRLRNLQARIQKDQHEADELKQVLNQTSEKENLLRAEIENLQTKTMALSNIVVNLERSLQNARQSPSLSPWPGFRSARWTGPFRRLYSLSPPPSWE